MVHGTFILKQHIYWARKCTSTVPYKQPTRDFWYSRGTLLLTTTKGREAYVPCTTFSKTMELLSYCRKYNIGLKLPGIQAPAQTHEVNLSEREKMWDIAPLEEYFNNGGIPTDPVELDQCTTVFNPLLFVISHLETIKSHNGNPVYQPYLDRLGTFRQKLESINLICVKDESN